jgi:hypothetical protein
MDYREDFKKSYFDGFKKIFPFLSENEFMSYYDESIYGGYPEEPSGSIWSSEGKSIYVLIRILKPKNILEIGNFKGRSTNHILQAVENNNLGSVTLIDIKESLEYENLHNKNFKRVIDNSLLFLDNELDYDLIIQDGNHEYLHVKKELELILKNNKNNNLIIWGHDYYKKIIGVCEVNKAVDELKDSFKQVVPMIDSISDCGLVIISKNL